MFSQVNIASKEARAALAQSENGSLALLSEEMQIKSTEKCCLLPLRMATIKNRKIKQALGPVTVLTDRPNGPRSISRVHMVEGETLLLKTVL